MTLPDPVREVFRGEHRLLVDSFAYRTAQITNPGDRGVARELLLRDTIKRHLPARYGVGRGQVVDSSGWLSRQQDLIVFDALRTPMIDSFEATQTYPRESVLALIQVKSVLDANGTKTAVNQLVGVAERDVALFEHPLDKYSPPIAQRARRHVWSAIFSYRLHSSLEAVARSLHQTNSRHERNSWVETLCVLDEGVLHYTGSANTQRLTLLRTADEEETFGLFFSILLNGIELASRRDQSPDLTAYFRHEVDAAAANADPLKAIPRRPRSPRTRDEK